MMIGDEFFWAMLTAVVAALSGGAIAGSVSTDLSRTLAACVGLAGVVGAMIVYLFSRAGFPSFWPLLAFAGFMFALVMSTATALVARRVQRARRARRADGQGPC